MGGRGGYFENIRIPPAICPFWADKGAVFSKVVLGFHDFEGDFANKCAAFFFANVIGGRVDLSLYWALYFSPRRRLARI